MLSGLLLPTERPPTDIDVKRALLVLDQVHVLSPSDREVIPPEHFMQVNSALVGVPFMPLSMSGGPVLPLGKLTGYDAHFDEAMSALRPAEASGALVVRSTPTFQQGLAIGFVAQPAGWPSSGFTWTIFKMLSDQPEFLQAAIEGLPGPESIGCRSIFAWVAPLAHAASIIVWGVAS